MRRQWKFALFAVAALCAMPVNSQPEIDCLPGVSEAEARTMGLPREAGMSYDEELLQKRKRAREADLARLKARYASVQAARNEAGAESQAEMK